MNIFFPFFQSKIYSKIPDVPFAEIDRLILNFIWKNKVSRIVQITTFYKRRTKLED